MMSSLSLYLRLTARPFCSSLLCCFPQQDEKDLLEGQLCPLHLKPCDERKEDNLFFALSRYQGQLEQLFESQPEFVRPSFRKNEVRGGRRDSVTREARFLLRLSES